MDRRQKFYCVGYAMDRRRTLELKAAAAEHRRQTLYCVGSAIDRLSTHCCDAIASDYRLGLVRHLYCPVVEVTYHSYLYCSFVLWSHN